ncbi:hypothetical protein SAMN04488579_11750 [Eubacterium barkeri]|uniref:Uncharacterized protein n=1 Tax=Eubacterium barkeri TaxID=1528 RepID=A0A1H3HD62_EUBBA|nr:hypothetical protein SAMN04488579_11750 [Eubacterium barkeri]
MNGRDLLGLFLCRLFGIADEKEQAITGQDRDNK